MNLTDRSVTTGSIRRYRDMQLSLNQVEQTSRKAVRGAGLDWGLAEDAGRAVRWLEMAGLPGMASLQELLGAVDHADLFSLALQPGEAGWISQAVPMSPLLVGPAIADHLWLARSDDRQPEIILVNIAFPLLCAGYAGVAAAQSGCPLVLRWEGQTLNITPNGMTLNSDDQQPGQPFATRMTVRLGDSAERACLPQVRLKAGSRQINARVLAALAVYAGKTCVQATDASRMAGAGAGLNDND